MLVYYTDWAAVIGHSSLVDTINAAIAALGVTDSDQCVDTAAAALDSRDVRTAVEAALPAGISLAGTSFYGPIPRPEDATELVAAAIASIDAIAIVIARYPAQRITTAEAAKILCASRAEAPRVLRRYGVDRVGVDTPVRGGASSLWDRASVEAVATKRRTERRGRYPRTTSQ